MKTYLLSIYLVILLGFIACQENTAVSNQLKPPTKSTTIEQRGKEASPSEIQAFLPEGMLVANHHGLNEIRRADITGDGIEDYIALVYKPGANQSMDQNDLMQLVVLKGTGNSYIPLEASGNLTCETFLASAKPKLIVGENAIQYLYEGFNFDITGEFKYNPKQGQMVMNKKILTYKRDQIPDGSGVVTFDYTMGTRISEWFRKNESGELRPFTTQKESLDGPAMKMSAVNLDVLADQ